MWPDNAACSDSSGPFFCYFLFVPVKGSCIVFSLELLEIALRVEISDNVTCVCNRPNLVSIMPQPQPVVGWIAVCFIR